MVKAEFRMLIEKFIIENGKKEGFLIYQNGSIYEGEWLNN
jgi:hypothetical protein